MADKPELPLGGMTMMGIAFTKETMKAVIARVQKLQSEGWTEAKILEKIRQEMPGFADHTVRRFYDLALGRPVPDDFKPQEIVAQKAVAKDTFELQLKGPRHELCLGSVVRFMGGDWYVKRTDGTQFTIRRIL